MKIHADGFAQTTCFVAGTLVHTKEGLVPIEQIKVGDWVLSFPDDQPIPKEYRQNPNAPKFYKRVTQNFVAENQPVTEFKVIDDTNNELVCFRATLNHPIFVKDRGWMTLEAIRQGPPVAVEEFEFYNRLLGSFMLDKGLATVYNIEVEDFHTYYVGEIGLWVHD